MNRLALCGLYYKHSLYEAMTHIYDNTAYFLHMELRNYTGNSMVV